MIYKRNRLLQAVMMIVVIILGLASRKMASNIPDFLNVYLGDALWALMVFIGIGFIFRKMQTKKVAFIAISFCYFIEISQLYHANWIDEIRRTTLGGLVLGYGFLWSDLLAYIIGTSVGIGIEILLRVIQKRKKSKPWGDI
jgi:ABC-type phosphate transport system permease subunit